MRMTASLAPVSIAAMTEQLRALGVTPGGVLLVHSSFRAVRPVEGGPEGLIAALQAAVGPEGTLVMPSWTDRDDVPFDPAEDRANTDLGVVPDIFWRLPGVLRSQHPFAFAARGPLAEQILADPLPMPPHIPESPVGRVHDRDGQVLLLGVGHDANTTIHLAELIAGVPYGVEHHITVATDGGPAPLDYLENDHCCKQFALVGDWLDERGLQQRGMVGHAPALLMRARDVVDVATAALARDLLVFLHPAEDACTECDEARASIPA